LLQWRLMSAKQDRTSTPPQADQPKPYFTADGTLVIPFNSDQKYHYWKPGGQKLDKTREELRATPPPPAV
jgi:hypothetical protein